MSLAIIFPSSSQKEKFIARQVIKTKLLDEKIPLKLMSSQFTAKFRFRRGAHYRLPLFNGEKFPPAMMAQHKGR